MDYEYGCPVSVNGDFVLSHGFSLEFERVGAVHEAVEDRVGEGRVAEVVVPFLDRQLAGDDGGAPAVAVLDDLEQVAAVLGAQRCEAPVVEDQDVGLGEAGEQLGVAPVGAADVEFVEQSRARAGTSALWRSRQAWWAKRAGEPGLAEAGWRR